MNELSGKVAVVTGGAAGIGRGITEALLEEGARVVIADVEAAVLELAVKELAEAGEVRGVLTDVSSAASVEALAEDVFSPEGACHLLFDNAGVTSGGGGRPWEQEANDWTWCFSVNVFGVANGVLSFVPRMIESGEPGVVVNTSSMDGGIAPVPYASVYASSKAAISCLTEALAHQLIAAGTDVRAACSTRRAGCSTPACGRPSATGPRRSAGPGPGHRRPERRSRSSRPSWRRRPLGGGHGPARARPLLRAGVKRGDFIIGHGLESAPSCCTAGPTRSGPGSSPGGAQLMTATAPARERYTVVSADGHAGATSRITARIWPADGTTSSTPGPPST